tara:strand:- start:2514 stop:3206 length:693 start_codon:yes stop_codon:yes gene_type:complete
MKNNTECHLLMHTACMSGNFLLWFMSQHDGFMHSDIFPRNTLIDKFWGDKADEPLHFAIEDHNLWKGAIAKSANTSHANIEKRTWQQHVDFYKEDKTFNKIAVKPNLVHNIKHAIKEDIIDQLMETVKPVCLYLPDVKDPVHFDKILQRANKLRPYGMDRNKHLLKNNLEGQRENVDALRTYCPVLEIDIGKLLFDYDEYEYEKLTNMLGSAKIVDWQELVRLHINTVYN